MEKLLRRSLLHRNQQVLKKRKDSGVALRKSWREYNRLKKMQEAEMVKLVRAERVARREDWDLGPLAPKRDVGVSKETFGAVSSLLGQAPQLPERHWGGPKGEGFDVLGSEDRRLPGFEDGEWRGEGLVGNVVVGDRVVVVEGRPGVVGRIGEVVRVDKKVDMVFVKGVNKVDMILPPQNQTPNEPKVFAQEIPIHVKDLRLVAQLYDTQAQAKRDVIVHTVIGRGPYLHRNEGSNLPRHTRYIKGGVSGSDEDIEIPWPEEDPDRYYAQAGDTLRQEVEKVSYQPALLMEYPMPDRVIDELRGKYTRSRREWDDVELMQKKLLEDARKDWFAERSKVLSEPFWTKEYMLAQKRAAQAAKEMQSADQ